MSNVARRDPRTVIPDFIDWFEEPFLGLRPYLAQHIRVEDFTEDGHYVVRAELAGINPEKDLEVSVSSGFLTIHAVRSDEFEGKHRSEFRYGSFSRTVALPAGADPNDVTASYADGILTVKVALKGEQKEAVKKIPIATSKK